MIRLMFCMLTSSNSVPAGQWSRHIPFTIKFTHLLKSYNSYFVLEIARLNYFLQGPSKFRPQYTQSWEYTSHLESATGEHNGRVVKGLMQNTDRSTVSTWLTDTTLTVSVCSWGSEVIGFTRASAWGTNREFSTLCTRSALSPGQTSCSKGVVCETQYKLAPPKTAQSMLSI